MPENLVQQILNLYGLQRYVVLSTEKGYRNENYPLVLPEGEKANLILYKCEPGILQKIKDANKVSNFLAENGFPSRRTRDDRIITMTSGGRVKYGALYNYLPGKTIPWEAYTMRHIKSLGETLSNMHASLHGLPYKPANAADECLGQAGRMQRYFADDQVSQAIMTKLGVKLAVNFAAMRRYLLLCRGLPGQQILHMDFVRSNVLFDDNGSITGILDFEKTAYGHPLFDIARSLAFLIVDCKYKPEEKVRKYFLCSGYNKRGRAQFRNITIQTSKEKINVLENLVMFFLLYDFYKFLRHNPYEYLSSNEHFVRTRDILLEKGLLLRSSQA